MVMYMLYLLMNKDFIKRGKKTEVIKFKNSVPSREENERVIINNLSYPHTFERSFSVKISTFHF